ncbi:MAG: caspase family protein [Treponema sp.]|jgi:hypothetical protein|nr:caspase family protein [Treponema sp.]
MKRTSFFLMIMLAVAIQGIFAQVDGTTKRYGLFIGANNGGQERETLRYAVSDAKAVSKVFLDMGGIQTQDAILLVEPSVREINQQINFISQQLNSAKKSYKRTELVFYYSGHSDEDGLLLNRERYDYKALRDRINGLPSDMRIIILDSCSSGAITRAKGGVKTKPFMIDDSNSAEGYAFLTSSSADEVSQESDLIESSYFTHSLLAGLRGAAETVGDRRITLNELYGFAYTETLAKTETSRYGAQHPNYDMQISGTGDVILTDLSETSASLLLGEDITGRISIRDSSDYLIAEVTKANHKAMELGLEPGRYQLTLQQGDRFFRTNVTLTEESQTPVKMGNFTQVNASPSTARGGNNGGSDDRDREAFVDDYVQLMEESRQNMNGNSSSSRNYDEDYRENYREEREEVIVEPFRLEFIQDSWFGINHEKTTNNFLFGFINADGHNLEGIGFSAILGLTNYGYVHGIQLSPFYNIGDSLQGAQISSVLNWSTKSFDGIQTGLINVSGGHGNGFQAGLVNWTGGSLDGFQSGLVNVTGGDGKSMQAGLVNWTGGSLDGFQPGLVNIAGGDSSGFQAGLLNIVGGPFGGLQAGLLNISGGGKKVASQIGLVNISGNPNTFTLGLLNFVKDGIFHPAFFMDDMQFANFSLRTGSKYFYTIWIAGFKQFDASQTGEPWTDFNNPNGNTYFTSRAGIGVELPLGPIFINLDATTGNIFNFTTMFDSDKKYEDSNTITAQARLSVGLELFEHLGAFAGISYDYFHRWNDSSPVPNSMGVVDKLAGNLPWSDANNIHRIGFFAGIQF